MRAISHQCFAIPASARAGAAGLRRWFLIGAAALAIATADVRAQVIISHSGSINPTTVMPGVEVYQITKNGLALQATLQGTKYWKDKDLN